MLHAVEAMLPRISEHIDRCPGYDMDRLYEELLSDERELDVLHERQSTVLRVVLGINALMFGMEFVVG